MFWFTRGEAEAAFGNMGAIVGSPLQLEFSRKSLRKFAQRARPNVAN